MEKFKKLNRAEMKNISGGQPMCPCNDIVVCNCDGANFCVVVSDSCDTGGQTPNQACVEFGCTGSAQNGCFFDCPLP